MLLLRSFLAVGFSVAFAASVFAAPGIEGTIVQVRHDPAARNAGSITIHRGSRNRAGLPLTFAVNASTRFRRLGQRGRGNSLTTIRALHRGERVRVFLGPVPTGAARVVEILSSNFNRGWTRYVSSFRHRSHHGRRYVHHRALPIQRRVVAQTVTRHNRPIVKNVVKKPRQPHINRHRSVRHFHRSSHHRR
jgi:hypothetical protein